ncbi:FAD-dependent monooxygenase [Limnohabitans sp. Rim8]|uniref:FAD-dependent monooxygenase n=1 Tax=Limnohabitans sp. Rim8 TaxID=1100718 RepID=UPI00330629DF
MSKPIVIAGGGIGGLAAALRCASSDVAVQLFERAKAFSEVGAGIQIGPNVTRILKAWGLDSAVQSVAAFPDFLRVRQAHSGAQTGQLRLGLSAVARYGAPYATIHRADLHDLLLQAVHEQARAQLILNQDVTGYAQQTDGVSVQLANGEPMMAKALVGADGLWSKVRAELLGDGEPRFTGHLAYRAMLLQSELPAALRTQNVTVWMGPRLHVVQYPVRRGELLNLVAIVHGPAPSDMTPWDHAANAAGLAHALGDICADLKALIEAAPEWRLWPLCDRVPLRGAHQQAQGAVALLGDAAHPMRPYMAQGAGMAIEDADTLGRCLALPGADMPAKLAHFAQLRWQRNARVQQRAIRNGQIFHAKGLLRWGRDTSIRLMGEGLLDVPWLYGGP